uniref:Uncharacterized protein n=1 Tax=Anguilla anguilla TaxID=7936 RepID=A0A0E9WG48_ANGAN
MVNYVGYCMALRRRPACTSHTMLKSSAEGSSATRQPETSFSPRPASNE